MDFAFSEDQLAIKDSVAKLCAQFDDRYWLKKDKEGGFPDDFYRAMADAPCRAAPDSATVCIRIAASVMPRPAPPYSSGMAMPSQPASAMVR